MDRIHRIGQKNKVFIYRLIIEGSVKQAISEHMEGTNCPMTAKPTQLDLILRPTFIYFTSLLAASNIHLPKCF